MAERVPVAHCQGHQSWVSRVRFDPWLKVTSPFFVGLARTIYLYTVYVRYFWQGITKFTVMCGVYIYGSGQPYSSASYLS
jgi:hypothetical protein